MNSRRYFINVLSTGTLRAYRAHVDFIVIKADGIADKNHAGSLYKILIFVAHHKPLSNRLLAGAESQPTNLLGDAQVLEDFAYALEQVGGQQSDVDRLRDGVAKIRKKSADKSDAYADITPYGTQCGSG